MRGSRAILRRIESSALVSTGRSVADSESWGAKLTTTLILSGSLGPRWTGGSCLKGSVAAGVVQPAETEPFKQEPPVQRHLLILCRERGVGIPAIRADPLATVAHQPIDVVLAL